MRSVQQLPASGVPQPFAHKQLRRRPHRWRALALCAATLITAGLAGCGGGSGSTGTSEPSTSIPSSVTVAWAAKIDALDPIIGFANQSLSVFNLIGGNLYVFSNTGQVVPGLAASGSQSSSRLSWTFHLRPDLKFSDGSPLTSANVVATIERDKNDKANGYAGLFAPISEVTAPNAQTVVFQLSRPYPSLPTILAEPEFMIMPKSGLAKGASFFNAPVSDGPYALVSWGGGNNSTFVVNRYYWGPKPVIHTLHYTTITDFNSRLSQLESGQIQAVVDLPPSVLSELKSYPQIHAYVQSIYGFDSLNMWDLKPPLNNVNLRKAISLAIDRAQLVSTVWDSEVKPMAGFWPATMSGYDSSIPTAQNLTDAKKLVADSPCAKGCTLTMEYTDAFSGSAQVALIIQSNLKEIGINTKIVDLDSGVWFNNLLHGTYQLSVSNLYDYANVPDGMIAYGVLPAGGLNANYSGWNSAKAVQLGEEAIVSGGAQRAAALSGINQAFLQDQPFATLMTYGVVFASRVSPDVLSLSPAEFVQVQSQGG